MKACAQAIISSNKARTTKRAVSSTRKARTLIRLYRARNSSTNEGSARWLGLGSLLNFELHQMLVLKKLIMLSVEQICSLKQLLFCIPTVSNFKWTRHFNFSRGKYAIAIKARPLYSLVVIKINFFDSLLNLIAGGLSRAQHDNSLPSLNLLDTSQPKNVKSDPLLP